MSFFSELRLYKIVKLFCLSAAALLPTGLVINALAIDSPDGYLSTPPYNSAELAGHSSLAVEAKLQEGIRPTGNEVFREPSFKALPKFTATQGGRYVARDSRGNTYFFTPKPRLQESAQHVLEKFKVPWGAFVAIEPKTGKVLAIASHSSQEPEIGDLTLRATFPAASLFKMITGAAGVERAGLTREDMVYFRGGNYELDKSNYYPSKKGDKRYMTLKEAMGKSCNPVFARVAMNFLSPASLAQYAQSFGLNRDIPFEVPVQRSTFTMTGDDYDFARTAAGFGAVRISPLHAALIGATFANGGRMMKPFLVEEASGPDGHYHAQPQGLRYAVLGSTAKEVMRMMESTTEIGTARRHFQLSPKSPLQGIKVTGKTGTLSGDSPKGLYHWFVGAAPADNPEIVVSSLVIERNGARIKASAIARHMLEQYYGEKLGIAVPEPVSYQPTRRGVKSYFPKRYSKSKVYRAPSKSYKSKKR